MLLSFRSRVGARVQWVGQSAGVASVTCCHGTSMGTHRFLRYDFVTGGYFSFRLFTCQSFLLMVMCAVFCYRLIGIFIPGQSLCLRTNES